MFYRDPDVELADRERTRKTMTIDDLIAAQNELLAKAGRFPVRVRMHSRDIERLSGAFDGTPREPSLGDLPVFSDDRVPEGKSKVIYNDEIDDMDSLAWSVPIVPPEVWEERDRMRAPVPPIGLPFDLMKPR